MRGLDYQRMVRWSGALLIAVVGALHLILAPMHFQAAVYIGLFFLANVGVALVAALNISRDALWGWILGFLTAGGAFVFYVLTRLLSFPGYSGAAGKWVEPFGILALVVEAAFVVLFLVAISAGLVRSQSQ